MIRVEREDAVAIVTVDRPDAMNALDVATLTELRDRLLELRDNPDVRAVVLTGAGDRAFIAGADIKAMSEMNVEQAKAWGELGHDAAQLLETVDSSRRHPERRALRRVAPTLQVHRSPDPRNEIAPVVEVEVRDHDRVHARPAVAVAQACEHSRSAVQQHRAGAVDEGARLRAARVRPRGRASDNRQLHVSVFTGAIPLCSAAWPPHQSN